MEEYVPFIGDSVYSYSAHLNEIIEGRVEGYVDEGRRKYKILQEVTKEGSEALRHIISAPYVFRTYEEALLCKSEVENLYAVSPAVPITTGDTVYLLDNKRHPLLDKEGKPCIYQVVATYPDRGRVSLVTSYGEHVGTYDIDEVSYASSKSIFRKDLYREGTTVIWADDEDVYEGILTTLYETSAKITNIKKLYPVDTSMRVPYWKIPEGRSDKEKSIHVVHTIVGDDLD